jgi:hypothetical protein
MNRLQKVGCARAYRRSSRSWKVKYWSKGTPNYVAAWIVEFTDEEDVRLAAVNRAHFDRVNDDQRRRDKKAGALPYPPPAEEM